jgi:hypothetical protein
MAQYTYTIDNLDINDFVAYAKSHVGETRELEYQTCSMYGEKAGEYTIVRFEASDDPRFTYRYRSDEEDRIPTGAELGYYYIKFSGSKWYNGKTIKCPVSAYVQDIDRKTGECFKTKALYVNTINMETGKRLKAYSFGIIDWEVRA